MTDFVSTPVAAQQLNISLRHIYRLMKDGTIPEPALRLGRGYLRLWSPEEIRRAQERLNKR